MPTMIFFLPAHYQREGSRCWQCGNQRTQGQRHGPEPDGVPLPRWSPQGNHPQDRPGRTPRPLRPPATKKVDFSSCTPGQHLRTGLVTFKEGLFRAHSAGRSAILGGEPQQATAAGLPLWRAANGVLGH